jgi:DNA (cytosine-5)-methyltransferase 1
VEIASLFSGIGGFDLAARSVGWRTKWYSEIDPYACGIMARRFPEAPNLGDITNIIRPPRAAVMCGGFPCQDVSLAGKGAGLDGARSGLWSHYARLIGETEPLYVVIENVAALRTRGLDRVLRDLDALGYDAEWHCIPASSVGAPHQRDRIWIIAYRQGSHTNGILDDRFREGLERHTRNGGPAEWEAEARPASSSGLRLMPNTGGRWSREPRVGRVVDGVPARVDRQRCLGNAVVPQIPQLIFAAIKEAHRSVGLSHI